VIEILRLKILKRGLIPQGLTIKAPNNKLQISNKFQF